MYFYLFRLINVSRLNDIPVLHVTNWSVFPENQWMKLAERCGCTMGHTGCSAKTLALPILKIWICGRNLHPPEHEAE